jgi:AraC family transcriptional regulator of adaptative response/methylated-DNA-[protein]-cysteine methyltransferase
MKMEAIILTGSRARPLSAGHDVSDIHCGQSPSPFGICHIAHSRFGICHLSFTGKNDNPLLLEEIRRDWPEARIHTDHTLARKLVDSLFKQSDTPALLIRGTPFQLSVWRALLAIPRGETTSYGALAASLERPGASRAAGTAVGANRIAWLIPCHRVLRGDGSIGGYRWGVETKRAMLAWEAARI